jgi:hypothetical protein
MKYEKRMGFSVHGRRDKLKKKREREILSGKFEDTKQVGDLCVDGMVIFK